MELAGGRLLNPGWSATIIDGRVTAHYPDRGDIIGFFTIISQYRPSILKGDVIISTRDAELVVGVLQADKVSVSGTQTWRFMARRGEPRTLPNVYTPPPPEITATPIRSQPTEHPEATKPTAHWVNIKD